MLKHKNTLFIYRSKNIWIDYKTNIEFYVDYFEINDYNEIENIIYENTYFTTAGIQKNCSPPKYKKLPQVVKNINTQEYTTTCIDRMLWVDNFILIGKMAKINGIYYNGIRFIKFIQYGPQKYIFLIHNNTSIIYVPYDRLNYGFCNDKIYNKLLKKNIVYLHMFLKNKLPKVLRQLIISVGV